LELDHTSARLGRGRRLMTRRSLAAHRRMTIRRQPTTRRRCQRDGNGARPQDGA